jgi:hypothetical protein
MFDGPSVHGPVVYRSRTPLSHSGKAGSTPVRATSGQALCSGARSKQPRRGGRPAGSHKAGFPGSTPGPGTRGWAGAQPSLMNWEDVVRLPYPQWQEVSSSGGTVRKPAERRRPPFGRCPEPRDLWVRLPPVLLQVVPRPVVQRQRLLSYKEETGVRFPPGRLGRLSCESGTYVTVRRCYGSAPSW